MNIQKSSLQKAIVGAVISLGLVAAIAWFTGSPERPQRTVTGVAPGERPPDLEEGENVREELTPTGLAVSERTTIQRTNPETGELEQEFFYEELTPYEQGVFELVEPQARLYLSPTRVIHLRSRAGRFVAPDNHPQSGEFRDDVVITVYQSEGGEQLDLSAESPHRVLQIELEQAEFDTVLGEIRSDSDVTVTTPATDQVEFAGRGMTLLYNELERRIEYMRIAHGQALRYRPAAADNEDADEEDATDTPPPQTDDDDADDDEPTQFYRLTFEQDIHAETAENRIEADELVAFFSLSRGSNDAEAEISRAPADREATRAGRSPGRARTTGNRPSVAANAVGAFAGATLVGLTNDEVDPDSPAAPDTTADTEEVEDALERTNEPPAPDPVDPNQLRQEADAEEMVMTWTGSLVMVPVDGPPPQLEGPGDVFVRFEGEPVRVGLADGEELLCRTLDYSELSGRIDAIGSDVYPMRITSPALGRATASRLIVDQHENRARLAGAGSIRSDREEGDDDEPEGEQAEGLPPGFRANWSDHVDIRFVEGDDRLGDVKSAEFMGDVHMRDERFELYSGSLRTRFGNEEDDDDGSPRLEQVEAERDVSVTMAESSIAAQWLEIETEMDESGDIQPARLRAEGDVKVVDASQQIEAGRLNVALGPADADEAADDDEDADGDATERMAGVEIQQLEAHENVRLMAADGSLARADFISADATRSEAHLRGEPVVLARYAEDADVETAEPLTELRVAELFLEDEGRLGHADGEGVFTYVERATEDDEADQRVRVTWSRRMQYDDATQTIEVVGDVRAEAEDGPLETNRLTAGELTLELVHPAVLAAAQGETDEENDDAATDQAEDEEADEGAVDSVLGGERQLRRLTARRDAVLLGTRWKDENQQRALTRFRVEGEELTFDNVDRIARVEGEGSLLTEDYRPEDEEVDDDSADTEAETEAESEADQSPTATEAAPMSGRGATLFTWVDALELDEGEAEMDMSGDVRMTHRPADRDDVIELHTDRLVGDMASMEGMEAMGMTDVDSMEVNHIAASGNVQVRDAERLIEAGQLFYDGPTRTILLRRGDQRSVQVIRLDEPRPLRASEILWNLEDDSIEILDADL